MKTASDLHGYGEGISPTKYLNHGCRCDECRAAFSDYQRRWRAANPDALGGRRLVTVRCRECLWSGRRDLRAGGEWGVTITPCPWCGAEVFV